MFKKLLLAITCCLLTLLTISCDSNNAEPDTIPDEYHGVWSSSFTFRGFDYENYLKISSTTIIHHLQREYSSDKCFENPITYKLIESIDRTYSFTTLSTETEAKFTFTQPQQICDNVECWMEIEVTSNAVYGQESYELNTESFVPSPQCVD